MRNKTLLFMAALTATLAASAGEWAQPAYTGAFQPLTAGDTIYIYNTEAQLFLTEGNDYGTHASVGLRGLRFVVNPYVPENGGWDGKTYNIFDESVTKGGWKKMFITDEGHVYVDLGNQEDYLWEFVDLGGNTYQIKGAALNPTWNGSGYMEQYRLGRYTEYVNSQDHISSGTGVIYDEDSEVAYSAGQFQTTWAFVSQTDYASYLVTVQTYEAAVALGLLIEEAETMGVTGLEEEKAVYGNTNSSLDQLLTASASVEKKVKDYYEGSITPDHPVNVLEDDCSATDGWVNGANASTFETGDWIGDGWEGFTAPYINIWDANLNGSIYRELADLPNGIYVVTLSAQAEKLPACVYANENQKSVPADNCGHIYKIATEVNNGQLQFGFRQETAGENWVTIDNVSVDYYGLGVESYRYWLNSLLESAPSFDEVVAMDSLINAYNTILASVETAKTKEEILAIIPAYEAILNVIYLNIKAYNNLFDTRDKANEFGKDPNINSYYGEKINDYVLEVVEPALEDHLLNTQAVEAMTAELQAIVDEAQQYIWDYQKLTDEVDKAAGIYESCKDQCSVEHAIAYQEWMAKYQETDFSTFTDSDLKALLEALYSIEFNLQVPAEPASDNNPIDYTAKIKYPSFDGGATGWINDGWSTCGTNDWNSWVDGVLFDELYLNLWNTTNARVYQTLTDLPAGAYTFELTAFADAEGLQVYANDDYLDVLVGQNEEGVACLYSNTDEALTIEDAGSIWRGNIYRIATVVGEDGTLEIGARNTGNGTLWAMIDKTSLTYYGSESVIVSRIIVPEKADINDISAIYTLSGIRAESLQKGINLVKMKDGSVRKLIVR